ncbi:GNAT family N-acetyltransferase [Aciduricibacillus chroicocephali]|uniref:GNAT family N-acetyltransferase n=1 Tax=Aciduricibacillus chroicocephali TaxID=3054939 RepID=A0ABY9KX83_9BACI|nr:GNAT family N-acetyltransferase [Bacillaceae bacterium 44XB]
MIGIHNVTEENYRSILKLEVSEGQEDFIETPYECLEEAAECKLYKLVGLSIDGDFAGFAMYGYFPAEKAEISGRLWIDRFLVDGNFQGKGLGKKFFQAIIQQVESEYGKQPIYLSVYAQNSVAIRMYEKFGFIPTGEQDVNGELIMVRSLEQGACNLHV